MVGVSEGNRHRDNNKGRFSGEIGATPIGLKECACGRVNGGGGMCREWWSGWLVVVGWLGGGCGWGWVEGGGGGVEIIPGKSM